MREEVLNLISSFCGQQQMLTIPKVFIEFTGSTDAALFLSQLLYWTDRSKDGWIAKSAAEWREELGLKTYTIRKLTDQFREMGFLETSLKKWDNAPTVHYRINAESFSDVFIPFLRKRKMDFANSENGLCENTKTHFVKTQEPYNITEITTEITTESLGAQKTRPQQTRSNRKSEFIIPTPDESRNFFATLDCPPEEADAFRDYYEANGWVTGKARTPMKNWQAAARNWHRNELQFNAERIAKKRANGRKADMTLDDMAQQIQAQLDAQKANKR